MLKNPSNGFRTVGHKGVLNHPRYEVPQVASDWLILGQVTIATAEVSPLTQSHVLKHLVEERWCYFRQPSSSRLSSSSSWKPTKVVELEPKSILHDSKSNIESTLMISKLYYLKDFLSCSPGCFTGTSKPETDVKTDLHCAAVILQPGDDLVFLQFSLSVTTGPGPRCNFHGPGHFCFLHVNIKDYILLHW